MTALGAIEDEGAWMASSCAVSLYLPLVWTFFLGALIWLVYPPSNGDSCIARWYGRDPYDKNTFYFDLV